VEAALLEALSSRTLPDGRRGFFHPDDFTFEQPVYLSRLYAAAQAVSGVRYVEIRTFQRLGIDSRAGLEDGVLTMGDWRSPSWRERSQLPGARSAAPDDGGRKMSLAPDASPRELNDCGCCEGLTARTPMAVVNRPGLSAICYRIGSHTPFKQSMLAALSDSRRLPLQRLNTRGR